MRNILFLLIFLMSTIFLGCEFEPSEQKTITIYTIKTECFSGGKKIHSSTVTSKDSLWISDYIARVYVTDTYKIYYAVGCIFYINEDEVAISKER
jgi:hypothetical protein